jgi:hypothetical protein
MFKKKKVVLGRPYAITTQEQSMITFVVGFVIFFITIANDPGFPLFYMILYLISVSVMFCGLVIPNYAITKYDLNFEIDPMRNPNYECVYRLTKNKKLFRRLEQTGPLGQVKGLIAGYNSDHINTGSYTITLQNGNHCIINPDVMSVNANIDEDIGWKLVKRKHRIFGFNAYRKALIENQIENTEDIIIKSPKLIERLKKQIKGEKK